MGIFYHNSDGLLMLCVPVRRTNINLSKSNFDIICDGAGMAPFDDLSPMRA